MAVVCLMDYQSLSAVECPDALRALPGWLIWRYEDGKAVSKPRKVPYYTAGGRRHGVQGRLEDRQQLTTFDAARVAAVRRGFDGVGFCLMPEWGVVALDFDHCALVDGLHPDIEPLVAGTYAEWSPSGTGVRAFMRGSLGDRKHTGPEAEADHGYGFETFSTKGFVTFTGKALPITRLTDALNTVAEIPPAVVALCEARFGSSRGPQDASASPTVPLGLTAAQMQDCLDVLDADSGHDFWLHIGMAVHHETAGAGFDLWDDWSSRGATYPGRDEVYARWTSFGRDDQRRPITAYFMVRAANARGAHVDIAHLEAEDLEGFEIAPAETRPAAVAHTKPSRFKVVPALEFSQGKPLAWIIRDVLPAADLVMLIGQSGAGKSFVAIDMAMAVARGAEWRGKRVRKGRVVYIAAEGAAGMRKRLKAYASAREVDLADLDFGVIPAAPNLIERDDALEICREVITAGGCDLLVIDTFAQATPGVNENSSEGVGRALANCRGLNVALRCPVLLVHHIGKDATRGARGWSGLKGNADAEIEVEKTPQGRVIRVSKQKDEEDGQTWGFELDIVPVGHDEDGAVITSCVVSEAPTPAGQQVRDFARRLGKWEALLVSAIQEIAQAQTAGIETSAIVDAAVARSPAPDAGKRDTRKQHALRALRALLDEPDSPYLLDDDGCLSII